MLSNGALIRLFFLVWFLNLLFSLAPAMTRLQAASLSDISRALFEQLSSPTSEDRAFDIAVIALETFIECFPQSLVETQLAAKNFSLLKDIKQWLVVLPNLTDARQIEMVQLVSKFLSRFAKYSTSVHSTMLKTLLPFLGSTRSLLKKHASSAIGTTILGTVRD